MVVSHGRSNQKPSGGRLVTNRGKRLFEMGSEPTLPRIAERKTKVTRSRGGQRKVKLMSCDVANVTDPATNKVVTAKITIVSDNPANLHFVRRNIITKGSIITTDKGKARVTNRPGQEGVVNAVLVK